MLAIEVYEKLNESGVPCNLVTGQECIEVPGAKHVACTVEMANISQVVQVAVIDEIQVS
jgi:ATP-dependent RNA helicase SUPV3L1/SUV3